MVVFIFTLFIVLLALFIGCMRLRQPKKEKISKEQYRTFQIFNECDALLRKRNWYLQEFESDLDYQKLKKLFDDLKFFQKEYIKATLNTPLILKKPHSPYTAAYLGTKLGGTACGMVAAQQTKEKQEAYEQSLYAAYSADTEKKHSINRIENCCGTILKIVKKNEELKKDWDKEKTAVIDKLNEQYRIN